MKYVVINPFWDRREDVPRDKGDVIDITQERADEIIAFRDDLIKAAPKKPNKPQE